MALHLITNPIQVQFSEPPRFVRKPHCPQSFIWKGHPYQIEALLREWRHSNSPRISSAKRRLGVARIYFRVQVTTGRIFDIYYDPAGDGAWILSAEHLDET